MTPERKAAVLAFGRYTSSATGVSVLTDRRAQGKLVMPVDQNESWSSISQELGGRSCILAVHRGDSRFDIIELIRTTKRAPNAEDIHREASAGMIADVMNATGTDLHGLAVEAKKLAAA